MTRLKRSWNRTDAERAAMIRRLGEEYQAQQAADLAVLRAALAGSAGPPAGPVSDTPGSVAGLEG